jgi:hypothetical protein
MGHIFLLLVYEVSCMLCCIFIGKAKCVSSGRHCLSVGGTETDIRSIYWAQLSRFHLKTETESSLQNVVFLIKGRTMNNVQDSDSYV